MQFFPYLCYCQFQTNQIQIVYTRLMFCFLNKILNVKIEKKIEWIALPNCCNWEGQIRDRILTNRQYFVSSFLNRWSLLNPSTKYLIWKIAITTKFMSCSHSFVFSNEKNEEETKKHKTPIGGKKNFRSNVMLKMM